MAIQPINVGSVAQDGADGDLARQAFIKTNANFQDLENRKVEKVTGKQLSTEDYTTAEKTKLAGIESGAQANTVTSVAGKTGAVTLVKANVGLSNVDNTSDANKPISTAVQTALNGKENSLGVGTTGQYLRGDKTFQTLNAATVGLGNVNNTSDANKPISTATQTALNGKQNLDATLTALAGLTTAADQIIYSTGVDQFAMNPLTSYIRGLLGDANDAAARTRLGLGTASTRNIQTSQLDTTAGSVLTVGAFGLGGTLVSLTDTNALDNVNYTGFHRVQTANVATVNGPPGASGGVVLTQYFSSSNISQTYWNVASTTAMWIRRYTNSWSAWSEVLTAGSYGIGTTSTTALTDLNTAIVSGFYSVSGTATNRPAAAGSANGNLIVTVGGTSSRCSQIFISDILSSPRIWMRNQTAASVWSDWVEFWHSGNLVRQTSSSDTTANSILSVGAFGLGGTIMSPPSDNMNNITVTGFYGISSSTTNVPPGAASGSTCLHIQWNSTNAQQLVMGRTTDRMFFRRLNTGTWSAWVEVYNSSSITGTVSQSGGVATGAVIERGSNSNGEYLRFADGTQICWLSQQTNLAIGTLMVGGYRSTGASWVYPAAFAALGRACVAEAGDLLSFGANTYSVGTASCSYVLRAVTSQAAENRLVNLLAIGRWY